MKKIKKIISVVLIFLIVLSSFMVVCAKEKNPYGILDVAFKDGLFTKNGLKPYIEYKEKIDKKGHVPNDIKEFGDWKYFIRNGKAIITNYMGKDKKLVLPRKVNNISVEGIEAEGMFEEKGCEQPLEFESVYIPKNIKYIREDLEFCHYIFNFSSIPLSKKYYYGVFGISGACRFSTKKYIVEKGNKVFYSKDGVLYTKDKKILIDYPSLKKGKKFIVPNFVRKINELAFSSNVKTLVVPATVKCIYDNGGCTIKKLYIKGKNTKLYGTNGGNSKSEKYGDPFYIRKLDADINKMNVYCKKDSIAYKVYKRRQKYQKKDESLKVKIHIIK